MDRIQKLLREIKNDRSIMAVRYKSSFLDNVANIFEKHGFGTAKVFLLEKQKSRELRRDQAHAILKILEKFENIPEIVTNRSIGRMIIKTLIVLTKTEV